MSDCNEIRCTACRNVINVVPSTSQPKLHEHPILKVIICNSCFVNHPFTKSCLWCGSSDIYLRCIKCPYQFCKNCLRYNFKEEVFNSLRRKKQWLCFICSPSPILELRALCTTTMEKLLSGDSAPILQKEMELDTEAVEKTKKEGDTSDTLTDSGGETGDDNDENNYDLNENDKNGNENDNLPNNIVKYPDLKELMETKEDVVRKTNQLFVFFNDGIGKTFNFVKELNKKHVKLTVIQKSFTNMVKLIEKFVNWSSKMKSELTKINEYWQNIYKISLIIKIEEMDNSNESVNVENDENDENIMPTAGRISRKAEQLQTKAVLMGKAKDISTLFAEELGFILKFKREMESQSSQVKVIQLGYTYLDNVLDKTINSLNLLKNELMETDRQWSKKYGVWLIKPDIQN